MTRKHINTSFVKHAVFMRKKNNIKNKQDEHKKNNVNKLQHYHESNTDKIKTQIDMINNYQKTKHNKKPNKTQINNDTKIHKEDLAYSGQEITNQEIIRPRFLIYQY